jgi:hypothetical protein
MSLGALYKVALFSVSLAQPDNKLFSELTTKLD